MLHLYIILILMVCWILFINNSKSNRKECYSRSLPEGTRILTKECYNCEIEPSSNTQVCNRI